MVASLSARGNAEAALSYYSHLSSDGQHSVADRTQADQAKYYLKGQEREEAPAPGRWVGQGAERLSLPHEVQERHFKAALQGMDPMTREQLVKAGGHSKSHSAGWDMTFSAPKSVSVVWALSGPEQREKIEQAQQQASKAACAWLEENAAFARRGKGGKVREATAGLLIAQFDHETSRDLDPQLHTHSFIFNMAPRKDGTWGAIVSRELYLHQMAAGRVYRQHLEEEMQKLGYQTEKAKHGFRLPIVPRHIERAFSKRRQAIEKVQKEKGYHTMAQLEQATLRTRKAKEQMGRASLFAAWQQEAKEMGFVLEEIKAREGERQVTSKPPASAEKNPSTCPGRQVTGKRNNKQSPAPVRGQKSLSVSSPDRQEKDEEAAKIGKQLGLALLTLKQSGNMQGLRTRLISKTGGLSLEYEENGKVQSKRRNDQDNEPENESE
ncbi:MobF family relaxase [Emcibacter nanhaiensis]|uniref:Conjugative relaxase n=1 Tax=Emcibacter nanhaiensis TaxID=1505037 RepID=A0A501PFR6_9PROT|nr:MobF family relaxase [Emcibacter nanhaiensis]TPD58988.1 conjugative relaxase [Emcibacter nanhaiensis]